MLYELIDHELVDVINDRAYQWQDAVKKTTQYLENKGYV
ncbi:PTS sugar transporter subunit IIA, partial [Vibrio parahaemolyticus]